MIGEQHVHQRASPLEVGELLHALHMRGPLRVEVGLGRLAEHEREGHLREQHRLQVRLGLDRLGQPLVDLVTARVGDGVALAVRAVARLGIAGDHLAVACQPSERGVHLTERQMLPAAEEIVVVALEVIAVARLPFKQAEQGAWDAHAGQYILSGYLKQIRTAGSRSITYSEKLCVSGTTWPNSQKLPAGNRNSRWGRCFARLTDAAHRSSRRKRWNACAAIDCSMASFADNSTSSARPRLPRAARRPAPASSPCA